MSQAGRSGATRTVGICGARIMSRSFLLAPTRRRSMCLAPSRTSHCSTPSSMPSCSCPLPPRCCSPDRKEDDDRLRKGCRGQRDLVLGHLAEVEPLPRTTCTHEIDATQPVEDMVAELVAIGGGVEI